MFNTNEVLVISDGVQAWVGSLTADEERFILWRTIEGEETASAVIPQLEAHRSHYGFTPHVDRTTGYIRYGFAVYIRQALPNASSIGFTGTLLLKSFVKFFEYIDLLFM